MAEIANGDGYTRSGTGERWADLTVDQDPQAKLIGQLRHELANQTRVIGLLVARLGGEVVLSDIEVAATDGVLYSREDRAAGGWRLWVKTDG